MLGRLLRRGGVSAASLGRSTVSGHVREASIAAVEPGRFGIPVAAGDGALSSAGVADYSARFLPAYVADPGHWALRGL